MLSIAELEQKLSGLKANLKVETDDADAALRSAWPLIESIAVDELNRDIEERIKRDPSKITADRIPGLRRLKKAIADLDNSGRGAAIEGHYQKRPYAHERDDWGKNDIYAQSQLAFCSLVNFVASKATEAIVGAGFVEGTEQIGTWRLEGNVFEFHSNPGHKLQASPELKKYAELLRKIADLRESVRRVEKELDTARALQVWKDA